MSFFNPNKIIKTAADFQQALRKSGMTADLRTGGPTPPHLLVQEAGLTFVVGVSPEAYTFVTTVSARLGVDFDKIASWNINKAFCSASYIEGQDKYMLTYALISSGGLLTRNAQAIAKRWPERVGLFVQHVGLDRSDIAVPRNA